MTNQYTDDDFPRLRTTQPIPAGYYADDDPGRTDPIHDQLDDNEVNDEVDPLPHGARMLSDRSFDVYEAHTIEYEGVLGGMGWNRHLINVAAWTVLVLIVLIGGPIVLSTAKLLLTILLDLIGRLH